MKLAPDGDPTTWFVCASASPKPPALAARGAETLPVVCLSISRAPSERVFLPSPQSLACHSAMFHQNDSYTQVNPRTEQWVTGRMAELGYTIDVAASEGLRSAAQLPWFKSNLFVLRRNVSLLNHRERGRISRTNWSALFQNAVDSSLKPIALSGSKGAGPRLGV